LGTQNFWIAEPALCGRGAEFGIRRRVPKEQRQTGSEGVIIEPAGRFLNNFKGVNCRFSERTWLLTERTEKVGVQVPVLGEGS